MTPETIEPTWKISNHESPPSHTPEKMTRVARDARRRLPYFAFWIVALLGLIIPHSVLGIEPGKKVELALAQDGRALLPIVVSKSASMETRKAAEELVGYLTRITGAPFKCQAGDGSAGIVVGTLAEFPNPSLSRSLEIRDAFDGREAYVIRSEPHRLLILAATNRGIAFAVSRFLEIAGCRWFFPAKEWEVVPSVPNLKIAANEAARPAYLSRMIVYGYGPFYRGSEVDPQAIQDYESWCRHNGMNSGYPGNTGSLQFAIGHAWQTVIQQNWKTFTDHPEYLPLIKGKRVPLSEPELESLQLCISNPAVRKLVTDWVLDHFAKDPNLDMCSVGPSDGTAQCQCENCLKLGSVRDRVYGFANEVARAVNKAYPGKMVGVLAYCDYSDPPDFPLEPNVGVMLTRGLNMSKSPFEELIVAWSKRCKWMGIYDYFSVYLWDHDLLAGSAPSSARVIKDSINLYAANHCIALNAESGCNWGPYGRGYYLASKLMWNPKADVPAILEDFYSKAFGPASAVMKRFYERYDLYNRPLICSLTLGNGLRDLEEASRLAAGRPDVLARLDHLKQYMHYMCLRDRLSNETEPEKRKATWIEILTHVWRTRYSYMNHFQAHFISGQSEARDELKDPAFNWMDKAPKPWFSKPPITREESEKDFRDDLAAFTKEVVDDRRFSMDLVPVRFGDEGPTPNVTFDFISQPPRYAVYSLKGEDVTISARYGNNPGSPDTRYRLTDSAGALVCAGTRPADDKPATPIVLKVPRPGLYFFDQTVGNTAVTSSAGAPNDRPLCVILAGGTEVYGGQPRLYFYVPKGTRKIQFYAWDNYGARLFQVRAPDGRPAEEMMSNSRKLRTVEVTPDDAGRVWSITGLNLTRLYFFNIPNVVAVSPNALMVPREVAVADKLTLVK